MAYLYVFHSPPAGGVLSSLMYKCFKFCKSPPKCLQTTPPPMHIPLFSSTSFLHFSNILSNAKAVLSAA